MAPELGLNIACLDRCIEFSCILPLLAGAKARVFTTPKGHMIVGSCRGQIDHDAARHGTLFKIGGHLCFRCSKTKLVLADLQTKCLCHCQYLQYLFYLAGLM